MKTSARNVFSGVVSALVEGAVNTEVELTLAGGDRLVAIITRNSAKELGLATGKNAVALIKAPWVVLVTDAAGVRFSARNQLTGTVSELKTGAINTDVVLTLAGGNRVHAVITNDAAVELGLTVGATASALIKSSHIVLGVSA